MNRRGFLAALTSQRDRLVEALREAIYGLCGNGGMRRASNTLDEIEKELKP